MIPAPDAPTGFAASQSGDDLLVEWDDPTADGNNIEFWVVGPLSAGRNPKIEQAKWYSSIGDNTAQSYKLLTNPATGRWTIFARIVDVTTGLVSTYASAYVDIS